MMTTMTREWGGLILETRFEYGVAARKNRGRFAGQKFHKLRCDYIVGVVDGSEHRPGSFGAAFVRTGKPILFSVQPVCGCTMGQMAGQPSTRLTVDDVTCEKCLKRMAT